MRAGFLLLALSVAAQSLSLLHLVAVPHVACPVHGELVHGEHPLGGLEHDLTESSGRTSSARWDRPEEQDKHDAHCGIALFSRRGQPVLAGEGLSARCARARERAELPPIRIERASGFPLYLLAPKASPPLLG